MTSAQNWPETATHYSLRTADVSPRSSPLRDVSRGGTQLAKRPSMAMSQEAMSEEELNSQNVPQWRWARRNVCRSQATTHSWHSSFKIEGLQFTNKIRVFFSNNLRSFCKYIIHSSPNWVKRLKVNIISCLAFKKAFRPLGTVLGLLSYVNINVSGHFISNCSFSTCAISLCARHEIHHGLTS